MYFGLKKKFFQLKGTNSYSVSAGRCWVLLLLLLLS